MSGSKFDVSIILNLHNEARYLRRTMLSLEEAVRFAQRYGITFELVAVLDRPDEATKDWIERYDFSAFDGLLVLQVNNGSLGLSRNDGIRAASGQYIATADGDDLISFNFFLECVAAARRMHRSIIIPQYLVAFGERYWTWEYFGTDKIPSDALFSSHPFISRIFVERALFEQVQYMHPQRELGYAFEDWHLAMEAVAAGYNFAIAPSVTFFYRQRSGSIMSNERGLSAISPPSRFLECEFFSMIFRRFAEEQQPKININNVRDRFLNSSLILETLVAANKIDPAINFQLIEASPFGTNLPERSPLHRAYAALCLLIGNQRFHDVLLLPFLVRGGADKYVLQVVNALQKIDPKRRCLVLCGQRIPKHEWLDRLPVNAVFVDLFNLASECSDDERALLAFRIIQAAAPNAEIHLKSCEFVTTFIRQFAFNLSKTGYSLNYYYFCDSQRAVRGKMFKEGVNFQLVSDFASSLKRIISDHLANLDELRVLCDVDADKLKVLYAECVALPQSTAHALYAEGRAQRRLIWASRLDAQKRPDLLAKLAQTIKDMNIAVHIDVFGAAVLDAFPENLFAGNDLVAYKGEFSGLDSINIQQYDAFLYTTAFDGLPNVILEAMSAGLPVIAPDVGGISEAVSNETGFLIENVADDDMLVQRYVDAIEVLYGARTDRSALAHRAVQLIRERHSESYYLARVAEIWGLDYKPEAGTDDAQQLPRSSIYLGDARTQSEV